MKWKDLIDLDGTGTVDFIKISHGPLNKCSLWFIVDYSVMERGRFQIFLVGIYSGALEYILSDQISTAKCCLYQFE